MSNEVGLLLRKWRNARRMTQEQVCQEAEVSTRHLSCVETGKSRPSAELLLILGSVLELPLRERNALLLAGGHAPAYRQSEWSSAELNDAKAVLQLMLDHAEPFPAVVVDGAWNLRMANGAAQLLVARFVQDPMALMALGEPNLLRMFLHPAGLRSRCLNWEQAAGSVLARAQQECVAMPDPSVEALLREVLAYPGIPNGWQHPPLESPGLLLPLRLGDGEQELNFVTTIATLGTAQDITLREVRVESLYPADAATADAWRALRG